MTTTSATAAVEQYLKQVYSKDSVFREHVLDLRYVDAFVGSLVYPTAEDQMAFMEGVRKDTPELTRERINEYFAQRPDFGEIFLRYVDTQDVNIINDDIYEFIAVRDPDGIVAIEEEKIITLTL